MDKNWRAQLADQQRYSDSQQNPKRSSMNETGDSPDNIHFRDIAPAIEFVCWVVVVLCPLLRLVNGAAVTSDQFVIQITLFSLALASGIGFRVYDYFAR